jgi:uncharacterized membrane protein YgcG
MCTACTRHVRCTYHGVCQHAGEESRLLAAAEAHPSGAPSSPTPTPPSSPQVVFWRRPLSSAAAFVLWQLVCTYGALWLSVTPLLLLTLLAHTYTASRRMPRILCAPSVSDLSLSLLLGWMPPISIVPPEVPPPSPAPPPPASVAAQSVADIAATAVALQRRGARPGAYPGSAGSLARAVERSRASLGGGGGCGGGCGDGGGGGGGGDGGGGGSSPSQGSGGNGSPRTPVDGLLLAAVEASPAHPVPGTPTATTPSVATPDATTPDATTPDTATLGVQSGAAGRRMAEEGDERGSSSEEETGPGHAARRPLAKELQANREAERLRVAAAAAGLKARVRARRRGRGLASSLRAGAVDGARAVVNFEAAQLHGINPMAPVLGPLQRELGERLRLARSLVSLLSWEDPALTLWLCAALLLLATALPLLPWQWLLRLVGLLLLGPHMRWCGLAHFARKRAAAALEQRYQAASTREARLILREQAEAHAEALRLERQRGIEAKRAAEAKQSAAWHAREEARRELLGAAHETLDVTGTLAVVDKYPTRADATRSSARAMSRVGRCDRELPRLTRVGRCGAGRLGMV